LLRIIGVQRNESPDKEFVLLQNQGSLRINLRGHVLISETALDGRDLNRSAHVFSEEVLVPAGMYVLLITGQGEPKWSRTKDGALIYHAYMGREFPVWDRSEPPLHVLCKQHSFAEPREPVLVLR
jgi:hypothetical protein